MKVEQKFHKGDLVRVMPLPKNMSHFPGQGEIGVILGSYWDVFRAHASQDDKKIYEINFKKYGPCSWYPEKILELVKKAEKCPTCGHVIMRKLK